MQNTKQALRQAVQDNIITDDQAQALARIFDKQDDETPRFVFTHILYYFGGLMAIGAMTLFMNLGWEAFGGAGIVSMSIFYALVGIKVTQIFADKNLPIPAGICAAFVVFLTPLAIYGLQHWLGVWPDNSVYRDYHTDVKWHWLYMELGTLAAGCIALWKYRYPFLMLPIAATLWYLTMDVTAIISGGDYNWDLRSLASIYTGLLVIGLAIWIDIRSRGKADYAFWVYIVGVLAFWGGLSSQHSTSEWSKFLYFWTNLAMIGVGAILVRRVFVVFGAIGCVGYLGHLAWNVFSDSWLFPVALSAIGFGVIYLGVLWQRHKTAITAALRRRLPVVLQQFSR